MREIEAIRQLRQPESFEECMSRLLCEIGNVERLPKLTPDQLDRLRQATVRLANASIKHGKRSRE